MQWNHFEHNMMTSENCNQMMDAKMDRPVVRYEHTDTTVQFQKLALKVGFKIVIEKAN